MNVMFWNIKGKNLSSSICNIAKAHRIDIIMLAECNIELGKLQLALNLNKTEYYLAPSLKSEKVKIFTKFSPNFVQAVFDGNRFTMKQIQLPLKEKLMLTGVHLVDKSNHSNPSQTIDANNVIQEIAQFEESNQCIFSVIVGDFNMNPFDHGLINSNGFHATMSSSIAKTGDRTIQGKKYKYRYNPMWSLYGDLHSEPAGTYYYKNAEHVNYQWNVFDQVILSADMIDHFDKQSLKILDNDGLNPLLSKNGTPNSAEYSDHLPIIFTINQKNLYNEK